ncbi:MAG: radical SAM protein, partial [Candidatus Omnitrophica bacterium]|nr:radical SAM protein [Candidatus Omnitrophota bacterium]MBU1929258.1 radical SAM protein [Candidatus Omnitrophota bacterium]
DMVCVGEGEYPMLELANSMQKGLVDYSIKNIWFKHNGNIIQNDIRELLDNLDSFPFADHDIYYDLSKFFKVGYNISTSRGCPNACTYCSHSYLHELYTGKGRYVRQRSVYNVISELLEAKRKFGFGLAVFMDDCFGMDIHWLKDFSQEYKKNIGVKYTCTMHPEHVYPESANILKESGCCQVTLGIQSLDESIRKDMMGRYTSNEVLYKAMNAIQDENINLLVDNMYGFPGQDEDNLIHLTRFYTYRKPKRIFFYRLKYFPNTRITKKVQESNELSALASREILDGKVKVGVSLDSFIHSRKNGSKIYSRLQFFLFLLDVLPGRITRYIIKNRLYRYYPSFLNPALFVAIRIIFASDYDSRLLRSRIILSYISFMRKRLCQV